MPPPSDFRRNRDDRLGLRLSPHDAGFPAAHIGFVHLDRAAQEITPRPHHGAPQLVQPSPGGLITAQAKNALQAERTDPVLLVGHVPHRLEPKAQWLSSALEDRPRRHRCLTLTPVASQLTPRRRPGVGSAARRASKTFRPTNTPKKLRTRRLRHEPRVEFSQGARVVDPAFGMGCRVRHPNILTSRERSGYPISGIRCSQPACVRVLPRQRL